MNARTVNNIWTGILYAIAAFVVALLVFLVYEILKEGWGFWDPSFLFGEPSNIKAGGGIGPQLFNSFYMLVITLIISIPLGLGAGIYLAEYAKQGRFLGFIRLCIETMASLPSIVVGLFGLLVFVTMTGWGYTVMGGALALTILNLPGLTRVCENAITEVPPNVKRSKSWTWCNKMADDCSYYSSNFFTTNYYRGNFSGWAYIWGSGRVNLYSGINIANFKLCSRFFKSGTSVKPISTS